MTLRYLKFKYGLVFLFILAFIPPAAVATSGALTPDEINTVSVYKKASAGVVNITSVVLHVDFFRGIIPREGAGSGAVGGLASGAKGGDVWKGALAGAGVNIVGGALLDSISGEKVESVRHVDSLDPQNAYGAGYKEGFNNGYKQGYTQGYKDGIKESMKGQ